MTSLATLMLGSGQKALSAEEYIARMEHAFEPAEEEDEREIKWRRENGLCEKTGRRPELCCCGGPGCIGIAVDREPIPHEERVRELAGQGAGTVDEDAEPAGPPIPPKKLAYHHTVWQDFVEADEIGPVIKTFARVRRMLKLPKDAWGMALYDALLASGERTMPVRVRQMCKELSKQRARRAEMPKGRCIQPFHAEQVGEMSLAVGDIVLVTDQGSDGWWEGTCGKRKGLFPGTFVKLEAHTGGGSASSGPLRVVVSGAGPVGLRCAVECLLYGIDVTIIEKRETFSRVNILTLWPQVKAQSPLALHPSLPSQLQPSHLVNRRDGTLADRRRPDVVRGEALLSAFHQPRRSAAPWHARDSTGAPPWGGEGCRGEGCAQSLSRLRRSPAGRCSLLVARAL